ncbi:MAG TPA: maleylpyruvate isomerase family mycothiol-dependent enzyme [Acidimicrobiales bacterium]|nr:maleylpyruvate isomerase family mycothiol-dependent enzyme [Acidimicrobiales bacterium]
MEVQEHVEAVEVAGDLLVSAAERAGLGAPVPTCPDWRVRDLLAHMAGVHRWATSYLKSGRANPVTIEEEAEFFAAPADAALLSWSRDSCHELVTALRGANPAMRCWSFLPAPSPLAFWARRQAHETSIHAVDAQLAAGSAPGPFPPDLAADGIDELVNGFYGRERSGPRSEQPVSLGIEADDVEGAQWLVEFGPGRVVHPGARQARHCQLSGPASELYLVLWNRARVGSLPLAECGQGIKFVGDSDILETWQTRAKIKWG